MLRLLKHEVSNYFANMVKIHIYNHITNQPINDICIVIILHFLNLLATGHHGQQCNDIPALDLI